MHYDNYNLHCVVALRKESVDRNIIEDVLYSIIIKSLSARRAWIEIWAWGLHGTGAGVALRKESVDRNVYQLLAIGKYAQVALRKESVDRNARSISAIRTP